LTSLDRSGSFPAVTHTPILDTELAAGLKSLPPMEFSPQTLPVMRELGAFGAVDCPADLERQELLAGPAGDVAVTLYRPAGASEPLPCLLWMHGGGMVIGNRHINDEALLTWCREFSCVCVTVEYRLAPEAPYPAALDDCYTALMHLISHADALGIDGARLGVGGQSAGGGLAAALALRIRDEGEHRLAFQYLEYPMLDDRQITPSSRLDELPMWNREANAFGWRCYLGDLYGTERVPAYAAPARIEDVTGLPPTFVCVGTADGFRDEDIAYAARLNLAGVPTELHVYAGAPHAFQLFADSEVGRCGVRDSESWLRRQLAPGSGGSSGAPIVQWTTT
jgi:acetyl esterase/lipase